MIFNAICHTWVESLGAERNFSALWCERSYCYVVDVPTLDVGHITSVLPRRWAAGVVVAAARQLGDVAVAAASAAPVHPHRVTDHPVEPDTRRATGTWERKRQREDCAWSSIVLKISIPKIILNWHLFDIKYKSARKLLLITPLIKVSVNPVIWHNDGIKCSYSSMQFSLQICIKHT